MTLDQLLDSVNASGISPEELSATLKGGAISVRNTTLNLKVSALQKLSLEQQNAINAQIKALNDEIEALKAQQIAAVGTD